MYKQHIVRLTTTLALIALSACSTEGDDLSSVTEPGADFNNEVYGHTSWDILSPMEVPRNEPTGKMRPAVQEFYGDNEYICDFTEFSLTDNPSEFISIQPDASNVWLGNLIQGDSHLNVGSLEALSIGDRAPMNISLDILFNDNTRTVSNPSLSTVNQAMGELISVAIQNGIEGPRDSFYDQKEAHSTFQTSLELGFSAEYLGAGAESSLEVNKRGDERTFFAYFIQKAFTFSMELPLNPEEMIADDFTQGALNDLKARGQIGEGNPPLYISGITYGKVLIYKMTASFESNRIAAAIEASYEGVSGSVSGYTEEQLQETLDSATIEITTFGGNQGAIEGMIRSGNLKDYFTADTRLDEFRPISFELRNLKDNSVAHIARTTEYEVKQCASVGSPVLKPIGEQTKITIKSAKIPHDCDSGIDPGDIFGYFNVISYNPATNAEYSRSIYEKSRGSTTRVASGNVLSIGRSYTINQYYGATFQLSGQLFDKDSGANAADDLVGRWNGNQNSISGKQPGSYSLTATKNCGGKQPVLYISLDRLEYLY